LCIWNNFKTRPSSGFDFVEAAFVGVFQTH
jgi:hypothetical protein